MPCSGSLAEELRWTEPHEGNGHEEAEDDVLFELAEFDFTELVKSVTLENFHFSQRRAVFEISWKEFGQDLELRVHIEPEEVDEESCSGGATSGQARLV